MADSKSALYLHDTFTCVSHGCYLRHILIETISMILYFGLDQFG